MESLFTAPACYCRVLGSAYFVPAAPRVLEGVSRRVWRGSPGYSLR